MPPLIKVLRQLLHFTVRNYLMRLKHLSSSQSCRQKSGHEDAKSHIQSTLSRHLTFPNILSDIRLHHWQSYLTRMMMLAKLANFNHIVPQ